MSNGFVSGEQTQMPEVMARPATLKDQVYKELKKLLKSGRLDPVTMYSANQFAIDLARNAAR